MAISRKGRALVAALERRFGEGSDELLDQLRKIALGKTIEVETEIPGVVKKLTPTISEMRDTCVYLIEMQHGRPRQAIEVAPPAPLKWAPERLSLAELEEMDRLARKAGAIDAEFTETPLLEEKNK